ncbi:MULTISPECIES: hypothetical protein [Flavobacteriaceae]|uniref:Uncharacterized protein n=2 Tax=Flavobacteriaceae TaxID=49546 RepID=A0A4R7JZY3_9FLAO|nr:MULTISPECIES: hypothetical protein [Flavobacteriaceae]MBD3863079.1 hypothetical protein [Olleya marilimosa]MBD3890577.1 hypothetical protein [Olleya marilimosa]TDT43835.1 hypothetical protein CLV90_2959 [Maribacter spongiicola]
MKKIILLLILAVGLLSFNRPNKNITTEKLTEDQLNFIKENYKWDSEEFLFVNFRQPESSCHYDNYQNLKNSSKWWTEFYSKMELQNVRNIFVYSDKLRAKKVIDSKNHFADINNFFLNQIFSNDKTCYGILIINKKGEYQKKAGEYMQKDIVYLISQFD